MASASSSRTTKLMYGKKVKLLLFQDGSTYSHAQVVAAGTIIHLAAENQTVLHDKQLLILRVRALAR